MSEEVPIEPLVDLYEALHNAASLPERDIAPVEDQMMLDETEAGQDYGAAALQYGLQLVSRLFLGEDGEPNDWTRGDDDGDPQWLHNFVDNFRGDLL